MADRTHVEVARAGIESLAEFQRKYPELGLSLRGADLSGVELTSANLFGADLIGANLAKAELSGVILGSAYAYGANFVDANLGGADLEGTKLSNADLKGCNLQNANFSNTILDDANLSYSHLINAHFERAEVDKTMFKGANFGWTIVAATDLRSVVGLESVYHCGPSSIGIDTLYASEGNIPDVFLRGCGVPEEFLAYKFSFVGSAFEFYSCFISYSHIDRQFARQLHDRLQGEGIRCWLDEHELKPGDDIYRCVDNGIRLWDKVLLCCSEASLKSPWVEREVDTAIEKEMKFQKTRGEQILKIIPLNLDGSLFSWEGSHAATLRKRLAADFTDWKSDADKFEQQFERVVKALRTDGAQLPPPVPKLGQ